MYFTFGDYRADIDVEATRKYYTEKAAENDCPCTGCVNFRKFAEVCSAEIKQAFYELGIENLKWVYEIIPYEQREEDYKKYGGNLYGGFFPVVGKLLGDKDLKPENSTWRITDCFELYLTREVSLRPKDFPPEVLQIEIYAHIPWLLNTENEYICR